MIGGQQRWEIVVESASVFGLSHSGCFRRERRRLVFLFNVLMIEKLHLVIIRDLPSGVYDDFDPAGGLQIILALVESYLGDRGTRMAHATYRTTVRVVTHARDLGALVRLCTGSLRSGRNGPVGRRAEARGSETSATSSRARSGSFRGFCFRPPPTR